MTTDLFSVKEKIVVITGGFGQLGRQFALALLEQGAKIAIFDISAEAPPFFCRLKELSTGDSVLSFKVDITKKGAFEDALDRLINRWDVPHALVNCAALDSPPHAPANENGPFEDYPEASWDKIMEVNVKGTFFSCQLIGGAMAKARRGSIVNISSTYGIVSPDQRIYEYRSKTGAPFYKPISYSASKSSLTNLTRYLATYWASQNVRVNTITLGGIFNDQDPEFLEGYCAASDNAAGAAFARPPFGG